MIDLILVFVAVFLLSWYSIRNHDYWVKRNVKHEAPLPFFGNHLRNLLLQRNGTAIVSELYRKYKGEKLVGYFRGTAPELVITDPAIMKHIFTADFDYFPSRGRLGSKYKDPLMHNVIFIDGDEWRKTRAKLTPAFSPGKLRAMFPLLLHCTEKLVNTVEILAKSQEEIHSYDLLTRFPLEYVASCGFGVELNALNAEHSKFVDLAISLFSRTKLDIFMIVLAELLPAKLFSPKFVPQELEDVMYNMTNQIRKERNYKPSGRNDLMDIIMKMEIDSKEDESRNDDVPIDVDFIAAQLFSLLLGGFETTSTSISFTLHQLAYHQEIQEKIQGEIDDVFSRNGGKLTYEGVAEMVKLEMAWKESLRLFSPFGGISRFCVKEYTIPGTNVTIDPGVRVTLPSQAVHLDPDYFEEPHEFRPERFAPGAESKISHAYSAFGEGPRKCLGMRQANVMSLAALAAILQKFTVKPGPSSVYHPKERNSPILAQNVEGGLPLRFIRRPIVD